MKPKRWPAAVQAVIDAGPMPHSPSLEALGQHIRETEQALLAQAFTSEEDVLLVLSRALKGELRPLSDAYWTLWREEAEAWEARFGLLPLKRSKK